MKQLSTDAMLTGYHYETVTAAINELKKRGYSIDFNLADRNLLEEHPEDFEITEVYRYEGDSDPGDESVVYAIESKSGQKGILVSGFGISMDSFAEKLLEKIHRRE